MTKIPIIVGYDAKGNGLVGYIHPFLSGRRKQEMRVPAEILDEKTGKTRQGWRCVADGADRPVPKAGKRTT